MGLADSPKLPNPILSAPTKLGEINDGMEKRDPIVSLILGIDLFGHKLEVHISLRCFSIVFKMYSVVG